jgi:hypothetical protein
MIELVDSLCGDYDAMYFAGRAVDAAELLGDQAPSQRRSPDVPSQVRLEVAQLMD